MKYICYIILISASPLYAAEFQEDASSQSQESSFDPFSDYSEFEEGSQEESDVNFFHDGRSISIGAAVGYQRFTDTYGQLYSPGFTYGVSVSYFFSLRFATQASFMSADHAFNVSDGKTRTNYSGSMTLSHLALDFKYYLNMQNVTRGLDKINPYLIAGISNYYRTITLSDKAGYARDTCYGAQVGVGIEVPLLKGKMFVGGQAAYNYIGFTDRGSPITDRDGNTIGPVMNGDAINFLGLVGANF